MNKINEINDQIAQLEAELQSLRNQAWNIEREGLVNPDPLLNDNEQEQQTIIHRLDVLIEQREAAKRQAPDLTVCNRCGNSARLDQVDEYGNCCS